MSLIFCDVGADFQSPCPNVGLGMTEFGAVEFKSRETFYGLPRKPDIDLYPSETKWTQTFREFAEWLQKFEGSPIFVSDNPAYDWQWINYHFHSEIGRNPFGHSARRIGDFYAGLVGDFRASSRWKRLRITKHDHNSVRDAMGNAEAFERMLKGERA